MSDMKPCGWTARSQSGAFLTLAAKRFQVECHPQLYSSDEIIPLYDSNTVAVAIAEAVAAEREKNLTAVESARIATDGWGDPIDDGDCERNEGVDLALEAIRSAEK